MLAAGDCHFFHVSTLTPTNIEYYFILFLDRLDVHSEDVIFKRKEGQLDDYQEKNGVKNSWSPRPGLRH